MLTRLTLTNFKAFHNLEHPIDLKPITVISGANSSGKSSLIQALLLLKQTLQGNRNRCLLLRGSFLNMSSYEELVFGKDKNQSMSIHITMKSTIADEILEDVFLSTYFNDASIEAIQTNPTLEATYQITFGLRTKDDINEVIVQSVDIESILGSLQNNPLKLSLKHIAGNYSGHFQIRDKTGSQDSTQFSEIDIWDYFLPSQVTLQMNTDETVTEEVVIEDIKDTNTEESSADEGESSGTFNIPLNLLGFPLLKTILGEKLHYICPLRSEPQRGYFISDDWADIGTKGEYLAQVLVESSDKLVPYIDGDAVEPITISLLEAVNKVLATIGIQQTIQPVVRDNFISQLTLPMIGNDTTKRNKQVSLLDVGFGISQILPIIVSGLLAAEGDILIFEQPEAHLHPAAQSNLAKFFVLLLKLGRQIIVETHSEHIINGLRLEILNDIDDTWKLNEKITTIFVRLPNKKNDGATIEYLKFDAYAHGMSWPQEFLPRSAVELETILHATASKRRRDRAKQQENKNPDKT